MFVFSGKDADFNDETISSSAAFVMAWHLSGVRSGLLSSNASLSTIIVQSEFAFSLFNDTPEKKILSFSNLNGIMAKERTFLPASFATCERTGANAAPDFPARFAIMTTVE